MSMQNIVSGILPVPYIPKEQFTLILATLPPYAHPSRQRDMLNFRVRPCFCQSVSKFNIPFAQCSDPPYDVCSPRETSIPFPGSGLLSLLVSNSISMADPTAFCPAQTFFTTQLPHSVLSRELSRQWFPSRISPHWCFRHRWPSPALSLRSLSDPPTSRTLPTSQTGKCYNGSNIL